MTGKVLKLLAKWKGRAGEIESSGTASDALIVYGMRVLIMELAEALKEDAVDVPEQSPSQPESSTEKLFLGSHVRVVPEQYAGQHPLVATALRTYDARREVQSQSTLPDATGMSNEPEVFSDSAYQKVWENLSHEGSVVTQSHPDEPEDSDPSSL